MKNIILATVVSLGLLFSTTAVRAECVLIEFFTDLEWVHVNTIPLNMTHESIDVSDIYTIEVFDTSPENILQQEFLTLGIFKGGCFTGVESVMLRSDLEEFIANLV